MAAKFWVGGGTNTNWNSSPVTNWANSSGGTGNQTAPATDDDVTFDNASGTTASVWNTAISLNSLVCSNSRNLVSGSAAITISGGNLALPGGVGATYSHTGTFTFTGTSGTQLLTTNGKTIPSATVNGVGGTVQLQDNYLSGAANTITLTNGTLDSQTFTVSVGLFSSNNANTRELKGSGAWTLTAISGTPYIGTSTITLTNFTSNIKISANTANSRTYAFGGVTISGGLTIAANATGGPANITGANTFGSFAQNGPSVTLFPSGNTTTITNAPTTGGTVGNECFVASGTIANTATISIASGTAKFSWCGFRDLTFSGGATFVSHNSFDLGHNSGITINAPNVTRSQHAQGQL